MKKFVLILSLLISGFTPEKKYKFEFNDTQLSLLWDAIDKSNAPHQQIKQLQELIQSQLKLQIDTTKHK